MVYTCEASSYLPDNSQQQQQPPTLFYLIDSLHDEARSELIAEQNLYGVPVQLQAFQPPNDPNYQNLSIEVSFLHFYLMGIALHRLTRKPENQGHIGVLLSKNRYIESLIFGFSN